MDRPPRGRILGIGSPYGDDCAGWLLARALRDGASGLSPARWDIHELDRPGLALLGWFEGAHHVVLLDAMVGGGEPGQLRELGIDRLGTLVKTWSSHGIGVAEAVQLAAAVGKLPGALRVFGLEINPSPTGDTASAALLAVIPAAARRLVRLL